MRYFAEDISGRPVYDRIGRSIGKVEGVEIDSDNWNVTGLRVELEKEAAKDIGVETPMLGRPVVVVERERVDVLGDAITLRETADELRSHVQRQP